MQAHENTIALEIIEQACREQPYCGACGEQTRPVARDGVVWLECPSWTDRKSRLARIVSLVTAHTRRALVDDSSTSALSPAC